MNECLIITGGDYAPLPKDLYSSTRFDVYACDSGYLNAKRMDIVPKLVIGDFDSMNIPFDTDAEIKVFPTIKDDTDTMLAVRYTLDKGYDCFHVACAFGGRLDHAFSNIQAAAFIASKGGIARLYGTNDIVTVFGASSTGAMDLNGNTPAKLSFPNMTGWSLSVFSLSDSCEGVTIRGTKYEVSDTVIYSNDPIGTSNVWTTPDAIISLKKGIIMVACSRLTPGEHI